MRCRCSAVECGCSVVSRASAGAAWAAQEAKGEAATGGRTAEPQRRTKRGQNQNCRTFSSVQFSSKGEQRGACYPVKAKAPFIGNATVKRQRNRGREPWRSKFQFRPGTHGPRICRPKDPCRPEEASSTFLASVDIFFVSALLLGELCSFDAGHSFSLLVLYSARHNTTPLNNTRQTQHTTTYHNIPHHIASHPTYHHTPPPTTHNDDPTNHSPQLHPPPNPLAQRRPPPNPTLHNRNPPPRLPLRRLPSQLLEHPIHTPQLFLLPAKTLLHIPQRPSNPNPRTPPPKRPLLAARKPVYKEIPALARGAEARVCAAAL